MEKVKRLKNTCIICGNKKIVFYTDSSTVEEALVPCTVCKEKYLKDSILLIEAGKAVDKNKNIIPVPTGDILILKDELFKDIFKKDVPSLRIGLVPLQTNEGVRKILAKRKEEFEVKGGKNENNN